MRAQGFIFGSNEAQAVTSDQQRTINWYVEPSTNPGATSEASLYPTPGVTSLVTADETPGRAHFYQSGREFAVIGPTLYEIDGAGVLTSRGTVGQDENPATISANGDGGNELWITSNTNGFIFDLTTDTLSQIAAMDGKCTMGDFLEGYFLALDGATSTLYISNLFDGTTWDTGTDFAQRTVGPDPWVAMRVSGRYVWLLGEKTSEVWYNSGDTFPLAFHPSGFVEYGCLAPWSVQTLEAAIIWLGTSASGDGRVLRAQGFEPKVLSTPAVEYAINNYDHPDGAQAFTYAESGHAFYVLSFDADGATWGLDVQLETAGWAERGTWKSETGEWVAWRPRWYARAYGEHRILDRESGDIYRMGAGEETDVDGRPIRRLRRSPCAMNENKRVFHSRFEVDLEAGLGDVSGQGADPQIMMRFSNDGGKTWSSERWRSAGKIGEYKHRVFWNRLGSARRRVYEVSVTDPIPWRLTAAYVDIEPEAG